MKDREEAVGIWWKINTNDIWLLRNDMSKEAWVLMCKIRCDLASKYDLTTIYSGKVDYFSN